MAPLRIFERKPDTWISNLESGAHKCYHFSNSATLSTLCQLLKVSFQLGYILQKLGKFQLSQNRNFHHYFIEVQDVEHKLLKKG